MQFLPTIFEGAWTIALSELADERGFFARTFCAETLRKRGLEQHFPQHSMSQSARRGTVRGMHVQRAPHTEVKLVRCLRGAVFDVLVDLRPDSATSAGGRRSSCRRQTGCSSTCRRASRMGSSR